MSQEFDYGDLARSTRNAEQKLAGADKESIVKILNEINGDLRGTSQDYKNMFNAQLHDRLQTDGLMGGVLSNLSAAEFDHLADGHKRITKKSLNAAADLDAAHDRSVDAMLISHMSDRDTFKDIQHGDGVHKHKFLFFGTKGSIDQKQIDKLPATEQDHLSAQQMLADFGRSDNFRELSNGRGFVTKNDIKHAIAENAVTGRYNDDEMASLRYMQDKFSKIAVSGVDAADPSIKGITETSMDAYGARRRVNYDTYVADQQFKNSMQDWEQTYSPAPESGPSTYEEKTPPAETEKRTQAADCADQTEALEARHQQLSDIERQMRLDSVVTVKPHQTLSQIALEKLQNDGSEDVSPIRVKAEVARLKMLNGIQNENFIVPNQVIHLYTETEMQKRIAQAQSQVSDNF